MFSVLNIFAVTSFENSGYGTSEGVGHFSNSCVHFPIVSQSDSKIFEFSDELQWHSIVLKIVSRRSIFAEENDACSDVMLAIAPPSRSIASFCC